MSGSKFSRVMVAVALASVVGGVVAAPAMAGKAPKGGTTTTTTTTSKGGGKGGSTTTSTVGDPMTAHKAVCAKVVEFTDCTLLKASAVNEGATGYTATSAPATGEVKYNSYYTQTQVAWERTVSHEVGGHHDAWNEIVAKVGVSQAWTDYYDLDYFAEPFMEARWLAVKGTVRDFTRSEAKEMYLDCVGPTAHGYAGAYLSARSMPDLATQQQFCTGNEQVMTDALTKVRPA